MGVAAMATKGTVVIGLAADSGCGKSTFMRRMTSIFGGEPKAPEGGNPESNPLLSDRTTVLCLDDYHCLDRFGRKEKNVTALAPEAQNFDLMYEQVKALKEGKTVGKPIYNHVSGLLDPAEEIESPEILIIEGLPRSSTSACRICSTSRSTSTSLTRSSTLGRSSATWAS